MPLERTLVLVKPDGVQRGLCGELIARFERRGLHLVGLKLMQLDTGLAERHYAEHRGKVFFPELVAFITSAPVAAMVLEGPLAVAVVRAMMGPTDPADAPAGTIRGDYAVSIARNIVHGSDSAQRAAEEIGIFFAPEDLVDWSSDLERWRA